MIIESNIKNYLEQFNLDVRKTKYGRWIDQKCTPDVIWSVSDFIMNYVLENKLDSKFTVKDIWNSDYASKFIKDEFSKPDSDSEKASNEYDKFFSQPMNLLFYANVLEDVSIGKKHLYRVKNFDLLEYIAQNDSSSYKFLCIYIEEVLKASGFWRLLSDFFDNQTSTNFALLKQGFEQFCYQNTKIKNKAETGRIFAKVINPVACKYRKKGTIKGHLSKNIIKKSDLMYNRDNFRDIYSEKPKEVSRKEWRESKEVSKYNEGFTKHQMVSAMKLLRRFSADYRMGMSELTMFSKNIATNDVNKPYILDKIRATQIHHIFPKNEYPEISSYIENLIFITPNQHYGYAHPQNRVQEVGLEAQKNLLIAKTYSIKKNFETKSEPKIYDFGNFIYVLNIGWDDDTVYEIAENDFSDVVQAINVHYARY